MEQQDGQKEEEVWVYGVGWLVGWFSFLVLMGDFRCRGAKKVK